jgi:ABC-type Zn uptake system ZnuABC Zn-binding protein ZnuA
MVVALNKADLLLEMGLSLESSWLPGLLLAARNEKLEPGKSGFVNCSAGWEALDVPEDLGRQQGELHPQGNPHFNLDPRAGRHLAQRIHEGLVAVDPDGEEYYSQRLAAYEKQLEAAEQRWAKLGDQLAGKRVAVYHVEYRYLANQLGMEVAASIEPKPGIPPSPGDIAKVVREMKEKDVKWILTAAWSNSRQVADVAEKAGAKVLELPNQVGGAPWADSWIALQDGAHQRLAEAFGLDWKTLVGEDGK